MAERNPSRRPLVALTGASRGIGRATAFELARCGSDLALVGRASDALTLTVEQARVAGAQVIHLECELSEPAQVSAAGRELASGERVPDCLINNAGTITRGSVEQQTLADFQRQIAVNLQAPFLLCRELLPAMRARGSGRLLQIGSIASTLGTTQSSIYNASKWGLVGFTKSLAEELSGSGLMTLTLLPGSVDTEMLQGSGFAPRMTAEAVAASIVYYALQAPLAHNGATIEMFGV